MSHRHLNILRPAVCGLIGSLTFMPVLPAIATAPAIGLSSLPPGKPAEQRNAALMYWRAWALADPEAMKADIDWAAIGSNLDPAKMPESYTKAVEAMKPYRDAIQDMIQASRQSVCDFELAYEDGFGLVMPHLSKMRGGARVLRADARRLLMENKPAEAAVRVAAMMRSSCQLRNEGVLISSLVGLAIANAAIDEGQVLVASGRLTRVEAGELVEAAAALTAPDAHGVRSCVAGEGQIMKDWIGQRFTGEHAGKEFVSTWFREVEGKPESAAARQTVGTMNGKQFSADVDRVLAGYKLVDQAWDAPDAAAQFDKISKRASSGEFGQLAVLVFPSFTKARESVSKFQAKAGEFNKNLAALK